MARTPAVLVASLAVLTALAACTGSGSSRPSGRATSSAAVPSAIGAADCRPASPITDTKSGPEIQGTGRGATLYGLLMPTKPLPIRARESVKVVWRMTGSGPLHLSATSPGGRSVPLQWGPEEHAGSNYHRPGQEWGAGYRFGTPGCWQLQARRTNASADVWVRVEPT